MNHTITNALAFYYLIALACSLIGGIWLRRRRERAELEAEQHACARALRWQREEEEAISEGMQLGSVVRLMPGQTAMWQQPESVGGAGPSEKPKPPVPLSVRW